MVTLIKNIKELIGCRNDSLLLLRGEQMSSTGIIKNAFLVIDGGIIKSYGKMEELDCDVRFDSVIDAAEKTVMPAFVDSHTHIVYGSSRELEFEDRINGLTYEQIAERGGGILNSAQITHSMSEKELYRSALSRVRECMQGGTCAMEIKSGYGLTVDDELKMLRVIRQIKESSSITIKSTFLGAHSFPKEYRNCRDKYVDLIIDEMIPEVARQGLADYIDVFCDDGFFTLEQTARILDRGGEYGLVPKIHANELACSGGVQLGVRHGALSVDHLERAYDDEIAALKGSSTMATLLPGAAFFLGLPYAAARKMIDGGLAVALASDYNPGSSPSSSMKFILSLASIKMGMTPIETLNAATLNGAYAMGISDSHGSITVGKKANLIITKPLPSFAYFNYAYTKDLIERTIYNRNY